MKIEFGGNFCFLSKENVTAINEVGIQMDYPICNTCKTGMTCIMGRTCSTWICGNGCKDQHENK